MTAPPAGCSAAPGTVEIGKGILRSVLSSFEDYLNLNQMLPQEIFHTVSGIQEPGRLADMLSSHLEIKLEDK